MGGRIGTGDFEKQRELKERIENLRIEGRDLENYTYWGTPRPHVAIEVNDNKYKFRYEMDEERRSRLKWQRQ